MTPGKYVALMEKLERILGVLEVADHVAEHTNRPGQGLEIAELVEATDILRAAYAKEHGTRRVVTQ